MNEEALEFSSSLAHDVAIFEYDVLVNAAHTLALLKAGILSSEEAGEILAALAEVRRRGIANGYEDLEEAIESEVTKITTAGRKMHTGKSRNDEVATCLRMFARDRLLEIAESICKLRRAILSVEVDAIMPGFTHMQPAQPTRLQHHLLTYERMLSRDFDRAIEAFRRVNLCPLGSAAFASTPYNIDRHYVAELLGFDGVAEHSEDAVASRDFLIESIYVASQTLLDLSRVAEEIVVFSNPNFGYVELPEEFASTSSIMPQKKNPDIAELVRANAAKLAGNLAAAMGIYKALPFSYNRDFQEMNPLLYDSLERARKAIEVMAKMFSKLSFNVEKLEEDASKGFTVATHLADWLVIKHGIPFRDAHRIVGKLAASEVSASKLSEVASQLGYSVEVNEEELAKILNPREVVEARKNVGGTAEEEVQRMKISALQKLEKDSRLVKILKERISTRLSRLRRLAASLGVEL